MDDGQTRQSCRGVLNLLEEISRVMTGVAEIAPKFV
jgi:hypothetical protein